MKKKPRALIFPSEQIRRTSLQVRLSEASLGSHNSQKLSKPIWYGVWKSHFCDPNFRTFATFLFGLLTVFCFLCRVAS